MVSTTAHSISAGLKSSQRAVCDAARSSQRTSNKTCWRRSGLSASSSTSCCLGTQRQILTLCCAQASVAVCQCRSRHVARRTPAPAEVVLEGNRPSRWSVCVCIYDKGNVSLRLGHTDGWSVIYLMSMPQPSQCSCQSCKCAAQSCCAPAGVWKKEREACRGRGGPINTLWE